MTGILNVGKSDFKVGCTYGYFLRIQGNIRMKFVQTIVKLSVNITSMVSAPGTLIILIKWQ